MSDEQKVLKSPVNNTEMVPVNFEGITVYHDVESDGHWIPRGQLKALAERQVQHELPPILDIDAETMQNSGRFAPDTGEEMVEYEFADSGIKIEQSVSTQGIWLDKGELRKLLEYVHRHDEDLSVNDIEEHGEKLPLTRALLAFLYQTTRRPPWI